MLKFGTRDFKITVFTCGGMSEECDISHSYQIEHPPTYASIAIQLVLAEGYDHYNNGIIYN